MCIENKEECDNLKNCITIIIYYEVWWNFITKKKKCIQMLIIQQFLKVIYRERKNYNDLILYIFQCLHVLKIIIKI